MKNRLITKVDIHKHQYPILGIYKYNAQVVRSVDGGKTYYCGNGQYCKTLKEARLFKRNIEKSK